MAADSGYVRWYGVRPWPSGSRRGPHPDTRESRAGRPRGRARACAGAPFHRDPHGGPGRPGTCRAQPPGGRRVGDGRRGARRRPGGRLPDASRSAGARRIRPPGPRRPLAGPSDRLSPRPATGGLGCGIGSAEVEVPDRGGDLALVVVPGDEPLPEGIGFTRYGGAARGPLVGEFLEQGRPFGAGTARLSGDEGGQDAVVRAAVPSRAGGRGVLRSHVHPNDAPPARTRPRRARRASDGQDASGSGRCPSRARTALNWAPVSSARLVNQSQMRKTTIPASEP